MDINGSKVGGFELTHALPMATIVEGQLWCGHDDCDKVVDQLGEDGYRRTWHLHLEGEEPVAMDGGSEDFGEDGDGEYKAICTFGHDNEVPFDLADVRWE